MSHLLVLSLHARPESEKRARLQLPPSWPPLLRCDMTGEEVVYSEWVPVNSALEQKTQEKRRIASILAHPFLEEIIDALRSDVAVWSPNGGDDKIRWVAEQLVLKLYGIEDGHSNLDAAFINEWYNRSRSLSNQFFDLVPEFKGPFLYPIANALNPNGSLDLWTGLYAFNAFRFHLIDVFESFRVAADVHKEEEFELLEPTLLCEKLLLNSIRIREHAVMGVLFAAQPILKASPISPGALMKRQVTKSASVSNIFSLIKTIIGNMHAFRLLIHEGRISVLCELMRNTGCWASLRSPSMTILMCAKQNKEFRRLYNAVVQYEISCIRECTAMTKIFYSNDIVAQFMEDNDLAVEAILKKSFLKIQICLQSQDTKIDDRIFKDLTTAQKDLIQAFHYESFYYARPSIVFPSFIRVMQHATNDATNPLVVICNLVTSDRYISLLKDSIDGIDPQLVSDLMGGQYFENAETSVRDLYKLVHEEAEKRENLKGDAFYSFQFTENELLVLSNVVRALGWGE